MRRVPLGLFQGLTLEIDFAKQTQLFLGLYETEIAHALTMSAAEAAWMIDIGAGVGELALWFLRRTNGTVYAYEPSGAARDAFDRNRHYNREGTLHLSAEGIGDRFALDEVPVDRSQKGLVKIDVDGAEMEVLRSGARLLGSHCADYVIEVHSQLLEAECIEVLSSAGYSAAVIDNAWWRVFVPERRPIPHNRWLHATPLAVRPKHMPLGIKQSYDALQREKAQPS